MQYTQKTLLDYLDTIPITYTLFQHEPLRTGAQAVAAMKKHGISGTGVKNLFLKDSKQNLYHIIALYNTQIKLKVIGKVIGAKELRFASPDLLQQYLGVEPGAVTPLALINDIQHKVQPIIDTQIFEHKQIQVHPLRNDATIVITPTDLVSFLKNIQKSYTMYTFEDNTHAC